MDRDRPGCTGLLALMALCAAASVFLPAIPACCPVLSQPLSATPAHLSHVGPWLWRLQAEEEATAT